MSTPAHPHPDRAKGVACVLFAVLVWSGWVITSRYSVTGTLSAYDITALRFAVAGVIMLPILMRKGWRIGRYGIAGGIFLSLTMGAAYNVVAVVGMKYAPTSHAAIIQTTMLASVSVLSVLLLREPTTKARLLGVGLSIVGIVILLSVEDTAKAQLAWLGHALFIRGGVMWSFYAIAVRAWKIDPLHVAAAVCVYSALLYLPIYLLFIPSHIAEADIREVVFQASYQGFINSVLALLCFNRSIGILGAATSSAFLPLVPVIATLAAIPLLGEVPSSIEWLGVAVATVGVFLATGMAARLYVSYHQKYLGNRRS